jgi:hypothetical protein
MKQTLYYAHIFQCEDIRKWVKKEDAEKSLESMISMIIGKTPKCGYAGTGVLEKEYDTSKMCYMGDAPFGCAGDYYM